MKNIGNTNDGNYLVEMNKSEFIEFVQLQRAVTGNEEFVSFHHDLTREIDLDFSNIFHVIRVFYLTKFKLNEFQNLLDKIKETLQNE